MANRSSLSRSKVNRLWLWLIEPSPAITEQDKRRQASLLSLLLLVIIIGTAMAELASIKLINWEEYTGYRQTIPGLFVLSLIYLISRTRYINIAAQLTVLFLSLMIFLTGWLQPNGARTGLLDFLILPLWMGSLYLHRSELAILILLNWAGLLLFPFTTNSISLDFMLVGPFSFNVITSVLLFVITNHRNLLEQDRRKELAEKENISQHEAARTKTLLRVAARLNLQKDLDALLQIISEETAAALNTPISVVSLYQSRQEALVPIRGEGLSHEEIESIPPFPKQRYDQTIQNLGLIFTLPDLANISTGSFIRAFKNLNFRSLANATVEYEHQLIGSLIAITRDEIRNFTEDDLILLKGIADQSALAIINWRLHDDAQRRLKNLEALRAIDTAILSTHDLDKNLDLLLGKITEQLGVDAALFLLFDRKNRQLYYTASQGLDISQFKQDTIPLGEGVAGRAAQEQKIIHISNINSDERAIPLLPLAKQEKFTSYYAVPLIVQGNIKGVLEIFNRSDMEPDKEWESFLEALAGQAAIAIDNTSLFADLQKSNNRLMQAYDSTIEGWSYALDLRDKETEGHTQRVTELTLELCKAFGFNDAELIHVRRGGLLHDIGKMGVPDRILFKETELDAEEWSLMKQHPEFAFAMLQPIDYLRQALDIPYCHHEKWDGSGYPRGLQADEIPLTARIFAVVDVWDAITSDRPYRAAWPLEKAMEHIKSESGKQFDPKVVKMFVELMDKTKIQKA